MTKAEEQSYKFWPVRIESTPFAPDGQDVNEVHRKIWQDGYEHAEKDVLKDARWIEIYDDTTWKMVDDFVHQNMDGAHRVIIVKK